ncbi:MAG: STAS domain-containing protein [Clostridia bacterium]|nr:STAS domain-containing protein [Clostridia bacterium]
MTIAKTAEGTKLTLALEGSLDTNTAPQLEETIANSIDGVTEMVLDLAKTEYLSSAGLRVILATQKQMSKVGSLTITNVNETIMEVFEVTGFTDILTIQ